MSVPAFSPWFPFRRLSVSVYWEHLLQFLAWDRQAEADRVIGARNILHGYEWELALERGRIEPRDPGWVWDDPETGDALADAGTITPAEKYGHSPFPIYFPGLIEPVRRKRRPA